MAEPETMPEATSPPPAPDPTLLPDTSVTYAHEPVDGTAPSITEVPAQVTAGLPELSVDLHIYSDDPAKRAVFINGRRYQRGSVLAEGPTVEEITREGAVLSYRGQRFLLPRQ
jgi:general secretion pathway protein B